jgi:hypothetical protein
MLTYVFGRDIPETRMIASWQEFKLGEVQSGYVPT